MKALLIIPLLCSSCIVATKDMVASLGGKSAYKSATFGLVQDHEDSFKSAAALAAIGLGAWQSVASTKSADALSATQNGNATKQAINANNNATAVELGAQATGLETTKATVLNPNAP